MEIKEVRLIKTDVTSIKIYKEYVLCGIGPYLHIYNLNSKSICNKLKIFTSRRIYGIDINNHNKILIYGENEIKVYNVDWETLKFSCYKSLLCEDWISASTWIELDQTIVLVSMHNIAEHYTNELNLIKNSTCEEQCTLFCSKISYNTWDELVVFSGTVFSEILVWKPSYQTNGFSPVLKKLIGHKGVLFSVDFNILNKYLCSTSDDRSIVFWKTDSDITCLTKVSTLYGHTGRVFRCKVLPTMIISCGEDGLLNLWNLKGDLIRTIEAHHGGAIWSLDTNNNLIITGGSDAAVIVFPIMPIEFNKKISLPKLEVPKSMILLFNNDIAVVTLNGAIYHYKSTDKCFSLVNTHDELKGYSVVEVYRSRKHFSISGYHGHIFIYNLVGEDLKLDTFYLMKSRILAFHWLTWNYFITCMEQGVLNLWTIRNKVPILFHTMKMKPSKEPWSTCACFIKTNILIGDRKGNLHLYSLHEKNAIFTVWKAHNYLGITKIIANDNEVTTLGRNSTIRKFRLFKNELIPLVSDKLPLVWLSDLIHINDSTLLLGFLGREFIMWDYKNRRSLHKVNCGGGHRSWDFNHVDTSTCFGYIKDGSVHQHICDWNSINSYNIVQPYNVGEINTLTCCKEFKRIFLISGGEDTILRLSSIDNTDKFENIKFLKSHISSIRCSDMIHIKDNKNLLITAGGRGQIIMWEIICDVNKIFCTEIFSYFEPVGNSDIRIMDICLLQFNLEYYIFAGCSDGHIKIYEAVNNKILYSWSIDYKRRCILKVATLVIENIIILLTTSTDGYLCFWITNFGNRTSKLIHSQHIHQSGVNSLSIQKFEGNRWGILSGGDDGIIQLNIFEFQLKTTDLDVLLIDSFLNSSTHWAQITGVYLSESYFITSSLDQKIAFFKYSVKDNSLEIDSVCNLFTTIADLKGMKVIDDQIDIQLILFGLGIEILRIKL